MTERRRQKGFTLVELAIVMVIIGLLIGGVLKGQKILENAQVSATITQVSSIDAAAKTFYDTYGGLPGDLANAPTRLPSCANCGITAASVPPAPPVDGAGDLIIGSSTWNMATFQSASTPLTGSPANETVLFWLELSRAGLLSGVTDDGINGVAASFGGSLPEAKIGGGFVVGWSSASGVMPGRPLTLAFNMPVGTVLALIPAPENLTDDPDVQVLSPMLAAQMDRKLDDGLSASGFVQAYGLGTSCYGGAGGSYDETLDSRDCGLYFRIMRN